LWGIIFQLVLWREKYGQNGRMNGKVKKAKINAYLWVLFSLLHDLAPDSLHSLVALALNRQLPDDVLG